MRTSLRFLLRLTVLVAVPLLGTGGRAQAGYVPPGFLDAAPPAGTAALGSAAAPAEFQQELDPQRDGQVQPKSLHLLWSVGSSVGLSGVGSPLPPGGPGGGSSPVPAATSRPPVEAPTLVGVVFLETTARRPPPFAARLFRPPRPFLRVVF